MIVILNHAAGSASKSADDSDDAIHALFAGSTDVRIMRPDANRDLSEIVREAAEDSDQLVVAGGGDGTVSAVAGALAESGKTLGVLPMGTLNHFAKDLGIPLELPAAAAIVTAGHIAQIDVGEVNGRVFINNSSLGIYPKIVAQREAQQEQKGRGKWPSFFWATLHSLHRFPFLNLRLNVDGQELNRRTAFLFIGNNEYEIEGFKLGGRRCLNAGKLGLYLARRTGRFGLFRLGFSALFGRLEQADDFETFCVEEATIEAHKSQVLVATDGEVTMMKTPLHYRMRPAALRVLIPRPGDVS